MGLSLVCQMCLRTVCASRFLFIICGTGAWFQGAPRLTMRRLTGSYGRTNGSLLSLSVRARVGLVASAGRPPTAALPVKVCGTKMYAP